MKKIFIIIFIFITASLFSDIEYGLSVGYTLKQYTFDIDNEEIVQMNYHNICMGLFLDLEYIRFGINYLQLFYGHGAISGSVMSTPENPAFNFFGLQLLLKYPFYNNNSAFWPVLSIGYELCINAYGNGLAFLDKTCYEYNTVSIGGGCGMNIENKSFSVIPVVLFVYDFYQENMSWTNVSGITESGIRIDVGIGISFRLF